MFDVNYLGGHLPTFALNFSRPGGQIVCQYYNFLRLGREGYRKIQQACYDTSAWLGTEIAKLGPFEPIYTGHGGIPGVTWTQKPDPNAPYTLYDLADTALRTRGWQVPAVHADADPIVKDPDLCSEFWCGMASAATWPVCSSTICRER